MKENIDRFRDFADDVSRAFGKDPNKRKEERKELAARFEQEREEQ